MKVTFPHDVVNSLEFYSKVLEPLNALKEASGRGGSKCFYRGGRCMVELSKFA